VILYRVEDTTKLLTVKANGFVPAPGGSIWFASMTGTDSEIKQRLIAFSPQPGKSFLYRVPDDNGLNPAPGDLIPALPNNPAHGQEYTVNVTVPPQRIEVKVGPNWVPIEDIGQ